MCKNSPQYERLPNRCLNDQRLGNIACQYCGKVAPEDLQKQISTGFVFETGDWLHNEDTNKLMCADCFKTHFQEAV